MTASTANLWAVAGLVYALAGASLLALSVFATLPPAHDTLNVDLRRSLEQWLDARIGAALIVVGFFLQMTGSIGTATLNTPAIFVLLGLALAAGYYALTKDLIVDRLAVATAQGAPALGESLRETTVSEPAESVVLAPAVLVPVIEQETTILEADPVVVDLRRESKG